jgi:hypothetical protein
VSEKENNNRNGNNSALYASTVVVSLFSLTDVFMTPKKKLELKVSFSLLSRLGDGWTLEAFIRFSTGTVSASTAEKIDEGGPCLNCASAFILRFGIRNAHGNVISRSHGGEFFIIR